MRIVDSHHHLWDPATRAYPWMDESVAAIRRRFTIDDLRAVAVPAISATIVVQAVAASDETQELLSVAEREELVAGVVGWIDLTAPDVAGAIAALRAGRGGQYLVGVRHQVHDERDPAWLSRDDVMRGLRAVAAAGLTFDLLVRPRELPAAIALAHRLPQLDFILDHGAKPDIARGQWEPWNAAITELAACPNVACKLSGFVTEADHCDWRAAQIEPYIKRLVEVFTPERLMFGSDWPVCLLAAPYAAVLDLASTALADLTEAERAAVFAGNAQRTYLERARRRAAVDR